MNINFSNRPNRRDFDVQKSFKKWVIPSIVLYFIVCGGIFGVLSVFLSPLTTFYAVFPICILFGFPIIWGAAVKQHHAMEASHHGYNVLEQETRPLFFFGTQSFKKYRKDTGGFQPTRIGFDPYTDKLADREQRQRKMDCETCGKEPHVNGGYFIEHRKVTRVLGLPVRERITKTDAYCSEHEPCDFL